MSAKTLVLSKKEEDERKLRALARVFERTDRIISGEEVTVTVIDDGPYIAWTNGAKITLNAKEIKSPTDLRSIVSLTGVNYHELCHVMLTPRTDTNLVAHIVHLGLYPVFNMLEDQRIEALFIALFPTASRYFTEMMLSYLATNEAMWKNNFPITHGRRYLPKDIRDEFERRFADPGLVPAIKEVVDYYLPLAFPGDEKPALWAVKRLAEILGKAGIPPAAIPQRCSQQPIQVGVAHKDAQEQAAAKVEAQIEADSSDEEEDEGDEDKASGSGGEGGEGDDSEEESKSTGSSGEEGEGDGSSSGTPGGGAGSTSPEMSDEALLEAMQAVQEAVYLDPDVLREVSEKQQVVKDGVQLDPVAGKDAGQVAHGNRNVPIDNVTVMRKVSRVLRGLRDDLDPAWQRGADSGSRFNVQRGMAAERDDSIEDIFDAWSEGLEDDASFEAVLLIDFSSSMAGVIDHASRVLWTIKRAVEETVGGRVTVIGFNSNSVVMYPGTERVGKSAYRSFVASGGTDPSSSLQHARRIFTTSKLPNKLLLIITDGDWYNDKVNDALVHGMHQEGVMTAMGFLPTYGGRPANKAQVKSHGCKVVEIIQTPDDILSLARACVSEMLRRKVRR